MSQPTPYARQSNLTTYALNNPAAPYSAPLVDAEFNAIAVSIDEIIANIALIQRDDGQLANGVVTPDSLNTATINMIGEWNPRGAWAAATNYAVLDMVTPSGGTLTYVCNTAHTSGATFAGDLALGYWQLVNGGSATASAVQFTTNNVILGRVTAGAGGGEEIVCTAFARTLLDDSDAATARTTLGLGSTSDPTFSDLTVDTITVSGLTASSMVYADASKVLTSTGAPTNGQILIGSTGAIPALGTLTGTANQVVVTNGAGSITLSLPQSIAAASSPTFAGLTLSGMTQGSVLFAGASSAVSQDNANFNFNDTNNTLSVGPSTANVVLNPVAPSGGVVCYSDSANSPQLELNGFRTGTENPFVVFRRSRGTRAAPSAILVNDQVGSVLWAARNAAGTSKNVGLIKSMITNAESANEFGSQLSFSTSKEGVGLTEVATLDHDGNWDVLGRLRATTNDSRGLDVIQSTTGTVDGLSYNKIALTETNVDAGANILNALTLNHTVTGTSTTAARNSLEVHLTLATPTNAANTLRFYNAAAFVTECTLGDGGGAGTEKGAVYGMNAYSILQTGATNMVHITAAEFNVNCSAGSSVLYKNGIHITGISTDAVNGSTYDAMISLSGQGGVGWLNGILFSAQSGGDPMAATGTLIKTSGADTVANGVDISSYTFTGSAFKSTGFNVNPTGVITACGGTATPAGGSTSARLLFGTTAGFGIYYGSGVPTVSAAQGSIYLRSDGSGVADRLYVNTDGATTWTNFVSAA